MRLEPGAVGDVAAAPIDLERRPHPVLGRAPVAVGHGRVGRVEHAPLQPPQVAAATQLAAPARRARRCSARTSPTKDSAVLRPSSAATSAAGRPTNGRRRRPPRPRRRRRRSSSRLLMMHGPAGEQVRLRAAVAERTGEHEAAVDVRVAPARPQSEGDGHVTGQLALDGHLQPSVTRLARDVGGGAEVDERRGVRLPQLERPRPDEQGSRQQLGRAGRGGAVGRPAGERLGVARGEPGERLLGGDQPGPGCARRLAGLLGVVGHGFVVVAREVGRAPVPRHPRRGRRRRVQHLSDEVVGELVRTAGHRQQPPRTAPARSAWTRPRRGSPSSAATVAGSTSAEMTEPARSRRSTDAPARATRASTASCNESGSDVVTGRETAQDLDHEQRVAAGAARR